MLRKTKSIKMVRLSRRGVRHARELIERLTQRYTRVTRGRRPNDELRDDEYWRAVDLLDESG